MVSPLGDNTTLVMWINIGQIKNLNLHFNHERHRLGATNILSRKFAENDLGSFIIHIRWAMITILTAMQCALTLNEQILYIQYVIRMLSQKQL